jgi:MYXO-CTERM domain-containing protein
MKKKIALLALLVICTTRTVHADVAPPPRANECLLLPVGATCYVEGGRRGVCDWNVHPVDRHGKACRLGKLPAVDAGDTSTNTAPAPTPEKSDCSFASGSAPRWWSGAWLILALIALFFRRQKHDARAR